MNPRLLAYLCFFTVIGAVVAAFMGAISWTGVFLIFIGTFVVAAINGLIIGMRLRNDRQ